MIQCPYCLDEVEVDDDGLCHCDCGANFWPTSGLFAPDAPEDDDEWRDEHGHDVRGPEMDPADIADILADEWDE